MRVATGRDAPSWKSYAANHLIAGASARIVTLCGAAGLRGWGAADVTTSVIPSERSESRDLHCPSNRLNAEGRRTAEHTENNSLGRALRTGASFPSTHDPKSLGGSGGEIPPPIRSDPAVSVPIRCNPLPCRWTARTNRPMCERSSAPSLVPPRPPRQSVGESSTRRLSHSRTHVLTHSRTCEPPSTSPRP
jgi:hypothetical protein